LNVNPESMEAWRVRDSAMIGFAEDAAKVDREEAL
jgi:hypothetical protein